MNRALLVVLCAGLAIRFVLAWVIPPGGDVLNYNHTAELTLAGQNIYQAGASYNYAPTFSYALAAFLWLSNTTGLSFAFVVRAALTLFDLGTAYFVFRAAGAKAFRFYWLNTGVICAVAFHGQFDTIAAMVILGAVALLRSWHLEPPRFLSST